MKSIVVTSKSIGLTIALIALASTGLGQSPKGKNVKPIPLDGVVFIDGKNAEIDINLPVNSVTGWNEKTNWTVVAIDKAGDVQKVQVAAVHKGEIAVAPSGTKPDDNSFALVPDSAGMPLVLGASQLIVRFADTAVTVVQVAKSITPGTGTTPSTPPSKQNSDIYLSGTYSPAVNSPPQYQIDGSMALMRDLNKNHPGYGQMGVVGSVTTDKRRQVDPDSFRIFGAYQNTPVKNWHGPLEGVLFTWLFAGAEFDRRGSNINFITSPSFDFPIRLYPLGNGKDRPKPKTLAVLTPTIGVEAGHNFYNAVTPDAGRGVFRGVVGGNLFFRFDPKIAGFSGVQLTSSYLLRLPAGEEIFTSTKMVNGQPVDVPFFSTKARHYIKQELDLKLFGGFSLALKHEYGAIPPVFRMEDHKVSVGLTFSLTQKNGGVRSAIINK